MNPIRGGLLLVALALITTVTMSATVLPYSYTTTGTIAGSPPNIVFNPQSTAVSGSTNAAGVALGLALGSFTLSKPGGQTTINYNNAFSLDIVFTVPTVTGASTFNALLSGTLRNGTGLSNVDLIFSPSTKTFNFTSPSNGSFDFTVHDILGMDNSAGNPATYSLTGDISNGQGGTLSAVPEPSSILLLLTVVGGVGFAIRRRMHHEHNITPTPAQS
jgi:hypothetical protein